MAERRVGDEGDLLAFVVSRNLHRRHLDESQRSMVAGKLATLERGRPEGKASIDAISQDAAADLLNVSRPSVQRARHVLDHGTAELQQAVSSGDSLKQKGEQNGEAYQGTAMDGKTRMVQRPDA